MTNAGKSLRVAQELNNVNSSKLAGLMGVSRQRVFQWRKQENMKLHTVQGLCEIFELTVDEFCKLCER
jgi:transcriptional regulator with XRE-family HTH domain